MANIINEDGFSKQTLPEIITELETQYKGVYGGDIELGSNTQDGQMIHIQAQAKADTLNFAEMMYNCFNVDTVRGTPQDILYKLNNVYRKSSLFTFVQVNVTVNKPLNLSGLDTNISNPDGVGYTVADGNGNQFILSNSVSLTGAGTYTLEFRAKPLGKIEVLPNTIVNMITVVGGVVAVNNPTVQYITGTDEESGVNFAIRRNESTAISGKGFIAALEAQLKNIPFVEFAKVYDRNSKDITPADNLPLTDIWCIVEGGENILIAQAIYGNLTMGCGMKGDILVVITKENGETEEIRFDRPIAQSLYIQLIVKSKTSIIPDVNFIKNQLSEKLLYSVYQAADASEITATTIIVDNGVYVTSSKVSNNNSTWADYLLPNSKLNFFTVTPDNIDITVG